MTWDFYGDGEDFVLKEKKERIGRNPKTKENFIIKKRKVITFKTSKNLIKLINI